MTEYDFVDTHMTLAGRAGRSDNFEFKPVRAFHKFTFAQGYAFHFEFRCVEIYFGSE